MPGPRVHLGLEVYPGSRPPFPLNWACGGEGEGRWWLEASEDQGPRGLLLDSCPEGPKSVPGNDHRGHHELRDPGVWP